MARRFGLRRRILEIGIAGDCDTEGKPLPGANREFFRSGHYATMDIHTSLNPDILLDLCDTEGVKLYAGAFDLVICSQVLEHVWEIHKAAKALHTLTASGGACIVDTPFGAPWHADTDSGGDYWRLTHQGMGHLLEGAGFEMIEVVELKAPGGATEVVSATAYK